MTEIENVIQDSKMRYQYIINNISNMVGELDLKGIFTYMNPYIYDELGYQPDELIGREIYDIVHPDDIKKITKVLLRTTKSQSFIPEIRLKNNNNQFIWYEIKARREKDNNRQKKIIITLKNISKFKALEEKLREKEEKYQRITNYIPEIQFWKVLTPSKYKNTIRTTSEMLKVIIENIPQCVYWKDTEFKYLGCNRNFTEFIRVDHPESIIGKTNEELFSNKEKLQQIRKYENTIIQSGKPIYHTNEIWITTERKEIWLDINRVPLFDSDENVIGILIMFEEITDRKIAEKKLQKSEEKYKNLNAELEMIMDNVPALIFYKDLKNNFIRVNRYVAEAHGMTKEELEGMSCFELYPEKQAQAYWKDDLEIINSKIPKLNFVEPWDITEERKWVNTSKIPLFNDQGECIGIIGISREVTEQVKAEKKLKESEEKFRVLAEQSLIGIQIILDNQTKYVNKQWTEISGFSVEEIISWKLEDQLNFIHPNYRETVRQQLIKKQRGDRDVINRYQVKCIKKTGETIWVEIFAKTIKYEEKFADFIMIIDITDRKFTQQKLKESEEKYRTLFEETLTPIFITDEKGKYIDANKAALDFVECDIDEIRKLNVFDFTPPQFLEIQRQKHSPFYSRRTLETEYYINGKIKTLLLNVVPFKIEGKKFLFGIGPDITARITVEEKLKESEEKYRNLVETSSMGLLELDIRKGGLVYINPRLLEIVGYTQEELLGNGMFYKAIYPDDYKKVTKSDEDKDIEFRIINKEGKIKWLSGRTLHHYNEQEKLVYLRLWLQDITQRKELEEIKSNLLTRISHEFKTPLISIKGFSDLLLTDHRNSLNNQTISFLERIKEGAEKLKIHINHFIDTILLDKKLVNLNKSHENLSNLIKKGIAEMEGFIKLRNHIINTNLPDDLIMYLDEDKIQTVISNLLTNAIKYTPRGGIITINSRIKKKTLIISVRDNGIGLQKKEIAQLFTPFGKIEKYGKGWDIISDGIGLGLYLSKEIIDLHNGKIWVESAGLNKGSTFYFSLPIIRNDNHG